MLYNINSSNNQCGYYNVDMLAYENIHCEYNNSIIYIYVTHTHTHI